MAKDVDLSSKEWCDLIFEGKNKEYGAYTLRSGSVKRHTFAITVVLAVLAAILTLLILIITGVFKTAEDVEDANAGQQAVTVASSEVEEEPEDEQVIEELPEPEPEVQYEEEVTASQAVTELVIAEEVDKDREVKEVDVTDTRSFGAEDVAGKEDVNKEAVVKEVIDEPKPVETKPKHEEPVSIAMVEQKPQFPGGDAAMYAWLGNNIIYPAAASEDGASGKVTVAFVVEKDGRISNVRVVRGKHPALDAEALRVVKKMPKWTPGRNNGQPVRVTYNLPVNFQLK